MDKIKVVDPKTKPIIDKDGFYTEHDRLQYEMDVKIELAKLLFGKSNIPDDDQKRLLDWVEKGIKKEYADLQAETARRYLMGKVVELYQDNSDAIGPYTVVNVVKSYTEGVLFNLHISFSESGSVLVFPVFKQIKIKVLDNS